MQSSKDYQVTFGMWNMDDIKHLEHTRIGDMTVFPDRNVSDLEYRTWFERLFSLPWRPWRRYKYTEAVYVIDKMVICSHSTYKKIKNRGSIFSPDETDKGKK